MVFKVTCLVFIKVLLSLHLSMDPSTSSLAL
jgi:hypothetical protein